MDELMLDGNAVAGALAEIFALDMTTASGTCATCGARNQLGAVQVFRSAGAVLRCPSCSSVLMTIVEAEPRMWITMRGVSALELHD